MSSRGPDASRDPRVVPLGRIVAGHGVRGLARVKPFNPASPTLASCGEARLAKPGQEPRTHRIRECRPHRGMLLVSFEGIDSLNDLEPWIGSTVEVDAGALAEPAEGELYHHETLGLEVRTTAGTRLGTIVDVMALPANDVWVVREGGADAAEGAREWLIPAVAPIVTEIDLRARVARIDPIPGLLDV
ncbi:MAG TPA: ribosome maturation factor RimM [Candidatus Binatia bacterium]|nr:ribosome maturation factor RimM [Candidatus Binatia bacterium]